MGVTGIRRAIGFVGSLAVLLPCSPPVLGQPGTGQDEDRETDPAVLEKLEEFQDWRFGLFLHWEVDPLAVAVVTPLLYLRGVIRRGVLTAAQLSALWDACTERWVGPVAAAKQALRLAGLSPSLTTCTNSDGDALDLLHAPAALVRSFALRALRASATMRSVASQSWSTSASSFALGFGEVIGHPPRLADLSRYTPSWL